jgi:hypothetical protein
MLGRAAPMLLILSALVYQSEVLSPTDNLFLVLVKVTDILYI